MDEDIIYSILDKVFSLSPVDRNAIFHKINDIVKDSAKSKELVLLFEQIFQERKYFAIDKAEEKSTGNSSPIFRRIG